MDPWKFASNSGKQTALAWACVAAGLILVIGFRDFSGSGLTNSLAGFLLGLLLMSVGIAASVVNGKQTILVEPGSRRIVIEDTNRFATETRLIAFDDIVHISIGYLGKKSNFVTWYYLTLKLGNGEEYPLFAPGRFYQGGSKRSVMEGRRRQLCQALKPRGDGKADEAFGGRISH